MNRKTRTNPAFGGGRQQRFELVGGRGVSWDSLRDDIHHDDLRYLLDPLSAGFAIQEDASWIAIPISMGKDPHRNGADPWCITQLAKTPIEHIYPAKSNGILQRMAREHLEECLLIAKSHRIQPEELPMSPEEAYDMDFELEAVAWPWLRDKKFLGELEKSMRMRIHDAMPIVAEGQKVEEELVKATTENFLRTGLHQEFVFRGMGDWVMCHEMDEILSLHGRDMEFPWGDLSDSLVLPRWAEYEEKVAPYLVYSSREGFFTDYEGMEDHEIWNLLHCLSDRIMSEKHGYKVYSKPATERVKKELHRLHGLVKERQRSEDAAVAHA